MPKRAPVEETSLAGELTYHSREYKDVLDTLRIVLANLESDLARWLAPRLDRPREAKKVLATLFAAPGRVRVTSKGLVVSLAPAATTSEREGIAELLRDLNDSRLTLPGDPDGRRLRFKLD